MTAARMFAPATLKTPEPSRSKTFEAYEFKALAEQGIKIQSEVSKTNISSFLILKNGEKLFLDEKDSRYRIHGLKPLSKQKLAVVYYIPKDQSGPGLVKIYDLNSAASSPVTLATNRFPQHIVELDGEVLLLGFEQNYFPLGNPGILYCNASTGKQLKPFQSVPELNTIVDGNISLTADQSKLIIQKIADTVITAELSSPLKSSAKKL